MGSNRAHMLLLVVFVSVITLILSTNYAFAATNPTADAGPDQVVDEGDTIQLDGSGSDVTGAATPYSWAYTSGPNPSPFVGAPCSGGSCTVNPSFTAFVAKPGNAVMNFTLTVTNGTGSDTDSMLVLVMGTSHKFNHVPGATLNLGQIITGKAFGIAIDKPGGIVSGFVRNLVIQTTIDGASVDIDFTQSPDAPPAFALPEILTAFFLDVVLTGINLSLASSLTATMPFSIDKDFGTADSFADGCPIVELQLLDETSGIWEQVPPGPDRVNADKFYVSNSDVDTVSVVDVSTNDIVDTITVGSSPKSLSFDNSTNRVYVANESDGTVSVIDTDESNESTENTVVGSPITVGTAPSSVAVNESTGRVYVTNSGSGTISVIDTTNNNVIDTITLVGTAPNSVAVNEATDRIYVTNGTLLVINTASDANTAVGSAITVGTAPSSVTVNESANGVYVANKDDGTVSVYNATTSTVVATITVGTDPTGLSFDNATKKLYVANSGSDNVSIIDTTINMVIATVGMGSGSAPSDLEANPSTSRIYVANSGTGTVSVIDGILGSTTEDEVIGTAISGFSSNFGIALNPTISNPVRDPSADTTDECAYIGVPPHFSKFAIGGIKALVIASLVSGGGGGGGSAPSFSDSTVASFGTGSDGFGVILSDTNQNLLENTATLSTGEKNMFRFDLAQYRGINGLAHVGFFFNLRGDDFMAQKWDTYITFDKGEPLQVVDPNGYFSEVDFKILEKDATNLVLKYEITFAKPMEKSHLLLKAWDTYRTGSNNLLLDAIEVVEGEKQTTTDESELLSDESGLLSDEPQLQETEISTGLFESLGKAREGLNEAKAIPVWIKTSAGWWSEKKISDSDFVLGIEFLIKNDVITVPQIESEIKSSPQIPDWISVNAGWWANEQISDEEFTQSLQWLIANGVMKI